MVPWSSNVLAPKVSRFLINLDRSPDRLAQFDAQAKKLGFDYERCSGVDGYQSVPDWLRDEFDPVGALTTGEIGCYASHLSVCRIVRDRGLDAAIVLEDDVELDPDFKELALAAICGAPDGWDIIHFSTKFKRPAYSIFALRRGRHLVRYSRLPANSAAYAISSPGASKLLKAGLRKLPFDMEFRYSWLRGLEVYGVYPPLARQRPDVSSTIDGACPASPTKRPQHVKPNLHSQLRGWLYVVRRIGLRAQISRAMGNADGRWLYPPRMDGDR